MTPRPAQAPAALRATCTPCDWLLHGPAQVRDGPERGAILGTVGEHAYAYPEIAGYYLQWLAWRDAIGGDRATARARALAVHHWLEGWISRPRLLTRVHLPGPVEDWRNDAVFAFDLAMVLRGLGSAQSRGLVAADPRLVSDLCERLRTLVADDGELLACRPEPRCGARWSTRRGPFLAKAAAGILSAARSLDVPPELRDAAQRTHAASLATLERAPHAEPHPALYALEGALAAGPTEKSCVVANALRGVAALVAAGPADPAWRSDVCAQYVRVRRLIHDGRDARIDAAIRDLDSCIDENGAVAFSRLGDRQPNVWCTMFAEQALAVHASPALAGTLRRYLV